MTAFPHPRHWYAKFTERERLRPDLTRAVRSSVAFMVPLLAVHFGWLGLDPVFACVAAHAVALTDVRGAYSFRLALMLALTAVLTASAALGWLGADHLGLALLATAAVMAGGGVWRHLSTDYGASTAVSSGLLFYISLGGAHHAAVANPVVSTLAGALWATLLHVALWPVRPQHPLRLAVAETWLALAEMVSSMGPDARGGPQRALDRELEMRAALNKAHAILGGAKAHAARISPHLKSLNLAAARLAVRVRAFRTAVERRPDDAEMKQFVAGLGPALASLGNIARAVALAAVSRQPGHLASFEVRLKRLQTLLAVARARVVSQLADPVVGGQFAELISQVENQLPEVRGALRATMERANERAAFSLELMDLGTLTLRPLAASLNLSARPEMALVRHAARAVVLGMVGVLIFKLSGSPYGYWLPFTILVVLQPDFGTTREKAASRVAGTMAGGLIASSLLWLHPPLAVLLAAIGVTNFLFGYFLKRNYGVAVVFVTLMIVLMMKSREPATLAFALERMGSTLAGGLLALGAALVFWPTWERGRFPAIFCKALAANRAYLDCILGLLREGAREEGQSGRARQAAESANAEAFSSLRRMIGDPKNQQEGLQESAALANGNQRIIHALSAIAVHLDDSRSRYPDLLDRVGQLAGTAFETLMALETFVTPEVPAAAAMRALGGFQLPEIAPEQRDPARFRDPWVLPELSRIITELNGMLLIAGPREAVGRENRRNRDFSRESR